MAETVKVVVTKEDGTTLLPWESLAWLIFALVLHGVVCFLPPLHPTHPPKVTDLNIDVPAQLALYEAGSACGGKQYLELLEPMPLPARVCPPGTLSALATGSRDLWDGPFSTPGCALKWFTAEEACKLMERVGTLYVIGDSLLRHLSQALEAVLSGDLELGGSLLEQTTGARCLENCRCDGQYEDANGVVEACETGKCPREASASWLGHRASPFSAQSAHACPSWNRKRLHFKFVVFTASDTSNAGSDWRFDPAAWATEMNSILGEAAADDVNATTPRGGARGGGAPGLTVLLAPPSSHLGYTEAARQLIESDFIAPVVAALQESSSAAGTVPPLRLLCMGMSARQNNKPEYLETQGNQHVVPYNEFLAQACASGSKEGPGIHYGGMMDTFAFTVNHTSLDGAHYDSTVNIPLAQVLLNALEEDLQRP